MSEIVNSNRRWKQVEQNIQGEGKGNG